MEAAELEESVEDVDFVESFLFSGDMKTGISQPPAPADRGVCFVPAISWGLVVVFATMGALTLLYVDVGDVAVIIPKPVVYSEAGGGVRDEEAMVVRLG